MTTAITRPSPRRGLREADTQASARRFWSEFVAAADPDPIAATARALGLSPGTVERWKSQGVPDGCDWEQFRIENAEGMARAQLATMGNDDEVRMHVEIVNAAKGLLGGVLSSLSGAALYVEPPPAEGEDTREPVRTLYDRAGNEVVLGTMRPKTASEAAKVLQSLSLVMDRGYAKVRDLVEASERVGTNEERVEQDMLRRFMAVIREKFPYMEAEVLQALVEADDVKAKGQVSVQEAGE